MTRRPKSILAKTRTFTRRGWRRCQKGEQELTAKLGESKSRWMENLLEEADTSKIREAVTGLTSITEDIQSKTEQVKGS